MTSQSNPSFTHQNLECFPLLNTLPALIWMSDAEGTAIFFNKAWLQFRGGSLTEELNSGWETKIHPDDYLSASKIYRTEFQSQKNFQREYRLQGADGQYHWILDQGAPQWTKDGEFAGYISSCVDITEQKKTEAALQSANEQLQAVLDAVPGSVSWMSADGHYLGVNRQLADNFQLPPEAFVGQQIGFLNRSPDFTNWMEEFFQSPEMSASQVINARSPQGLTRSHLIVVQKYYFGKAAVSVGIDITALKQAEEALQTLNRELETKVQERTAKLQETVAALETEIAERQQAIDDRQRSEAALKESQERLQAILDNSPAVIYLIDTQNQYILVNAHFEKLFKITGAEIEGKSITEVWSADVAESLIQNNHQVITSKQPLEVEEVIPHKDGLHTYISVKFPLLDDHGVPYAVCGISTDITDRKRAEEALRESERRYQTIAEVSPVGIFHTDAHGNWRYVNERWCEISGLLPEESLDSNWIQGLHPEDRDRIAQEWQQTIELNRKSSLEFRFLRPDGSIGSIFPFYSEYRFLRPDGTVSWVYGQALAERQENGEIVGYVGTVTDISEHKAVEEALRESEMTLRLALNSAQMGTWDWKLASGKLTWSGQTQAIFDCPAKALPTTYQDYLQYVHPDDRPIVVEAITRSLKEETPYNFEHRIVASDGEIRWVASRGDVQRDSNGHALSMLGVIMDITQRKQAETDLKLTQARLKFLLASSPAVIYSRKASEDSAVTYISENIAAITGYEPNDFLHNSQFWIEHIHPEDRSLVLLAHSQVLEDNYSVREYRFLHKNGHYCWISDQTKLIQDAEGNPLEIIGYLADISDVYNELRLRKEAEEQLKSSLQEKEVLLKEIHHRVKNNLQIISSLLKLQSGYIEDEQTLLQLTDSYNRVRSMALIHEKLYQSQDIARIEASDYIKNLAANLFRSYNVSSSWIELNTEIDDLLLDIDTAIPCGLIINELLTNSLKYAFTGQKHGEISIQFLQQDDQTITLSLKDNGVGLPTDLNIEESESLGLQLVSNLTEQLNGHLQVESDTGTHFSITFKPLKSLTK